MLPSFPGGMRMGKPPEYAVNASTPDEIQDLIKSGPTLVLFFSPSIMESHMQQAIWDKVAAKLNSTKSGYMESDGERKKINVAKIDAERWEDFASAKEVEKFPDILLFKNGEPLAS